MATVNASSCSNFTTDGCAPTTLMTYATITGATCIASKFAAGSPTLWQAAAHDEQIAALGHEDGARPALLAAEGEATRLSEAEDRNDAVVEPAAIGMPRGAVAVVAIEVNQALS